ncbi:hypothetical protein HUJ04_011408 [Dendroctonus ponderosae]|nr:hypothetical protein HUJ04_011408 [Dendroctonus ponderosae]
MEILMLVMTGVCLSNTRTIQKAESFWEISEDIPDVTLDELRAALCEMKNNRVAGDDQIEIEAIRLGGTLLHQMLYKLYNTCLTSDSPSQWN